MPYLVQHSVEHQVLVDQGTGRIYCPHCRKTVGWKGKIFTES